MGREVRRVPPNWQHPKKTNPYTGAEQDQPMFDQNFADAAREWKDGFAKWEAGERPSYFDRSGEDADLEYWEWETSPPDRAYYRPWRDEEATWFQVWQTVSEGSPVTPPFETPEELIDYLATHGDFWDQKRGDPPWSRRAAEQFVGVGWAPSLIATGDQVYEPRDGSPLAGPPQ